MFVASGLLIQLSNTGKMRSLIIFSLFLSFLAFSNSNPLLSADEELQNNLIELLTPYREALKAAFWELSGTTYNNPFADTVIQPYADYITCDVCTRGLPVLQQALRLGVPKVLISNIVNGVVCNILKVVEPLEVCRGTISAYANTVLYIVDKNNDIAHNDFCGIINPGCTVVSEQYTNWTTLINEEKPAVPEPAIPNDGATLTKILHFTDIHLDLDYTEGMNADCGKPVCCRLVDGAGTGDNVAGRYGDFGCALPLDALSAMYTDAKETYGDAELIFLTGDYIHSGIWLYNRTENTRHLYTVTSLLKNTFPSAEIFPLVGNHEPDVVNQYPAASAWNDPDFTFQLEWMYDAVISPFNVSLPEEELRRFLNFGYYTALTKKDAKLRIVVLNTNLCYVNNLWLPVDAVDPFNQLQWFADTLYRAEQDGEKVFVLGHIHPGSGACWPVWSNQFSRIITRFGYIIRGQFYGHAHKSDFKLAFDEDTGKPISVSFIGGSGLTDGMNPAYNVLYADGGSTWEIVNYEMRVLNLSESNRDREPRISTLVNVQRDYGLKNMMPDQIHDLINSMLCNNDIFYKYQTVVFKGEDSDRFRPCGTDDVNCRANILGDLLVSNSADLSHRDNFIESMRTMECNNGKTVVSASIFFTILLTGLAVFA